MYATLYEYALLLREVGLLVMERFKEAEEKQIS